MAGTTDPQDYTSDIYDLMLAHQSVQEFLDAVVRLSATIMAPADVVSGITYRNRRRMVTLVSSIPEVGVLDELQYDAGDGPCLTALNTGTTTVVDDTDADQRWRGYLRAVADHGYLSMMGMPLPLRARDDGTDDGRSEGAASINFYGAERAVFTPERQRAAEAFATSAGAALSLIVKVDDARDQTAHMVAATETRSAIDVAVGIIMAQNRCSQEEAFRILRSSSNNQNVKVHTLAQLILERASNPAPVVPHTGNTAPNP